MMLSVDGQSLKKENELLKNDQTESKSADVSRLEMKLEQKEFMLSELEGKCRLLGKDKEELEQKVEELTEENRKMREGKGNEKKHEAKLVKSSGENSIAFRKYETKTYNAQFSGKYGGKKVKVKIHTLKPGSIASILKWE